MKKTNFLQEVIVDCIKFERLQTCHVHWVASTKLTLVSLACSASMKAADRVWVVKVPALNWSADSDIRFSEPVTVPVILGKARSW